MATQLTLNDGSLNSAGALAIKTNGTTQAINITTGQQVEFNDGSASAPSITNTGDGNTGVFFPDADTVGITTGGTERARVDSSGNLGLGATPNSWYSLSKAIEIGAGGAVQARTNDAITFELTSNAYLNTSGNWIYKTTNRASLFNLTNGAFAWLQAASGTAGNAITFTQAMTLDASGNLGVGTTSPSGTIGAGYTSRLTAYASSNAAINIKDVNGDWFLGTTSANLTFYSNTAGAERARIDSSGNFIVGKASTSNGLNGAYLNSTGQWYCSNVNAATFYHVYDTTNSVYRFYISGGGQVYATNTSIIALSDVSLKENIRDLDTGLNEVMALKPRRFDWKNGDATNVAGFIAQELEEVMPDLVYESMYSEEETKKSIKMGDILPTLVKAIQELKAEFDAYKASHP